MAPCRRCSIITTRCGCGLWVPHRVVTARWRSRLPAAVDARGLPAAGGCGRPRARTARRACITEQGQAAETRLAPAAGVMVQAVWFDAGAAEAGRLLLTIHHLAVDGVSWRILVPDLAAAWAAIADGKKPALAATRNVVAGLGAAAGGGSAGRRAGRGAFVLARDAARAVAVAGRWRARSGARHHRDRRAADLDVAGGGHRAAADAGCRRRSMAASTRCC